MFLFHKADMDQRLLSEFIDKCGGDMVLANCYKSKLEFGCTYKKSIEEKISTIVKDIEEYPWWIDLLD